MRCCWRVVMRLLRHGTRTSAGMFFLRRFFLRVFRLHALPELRGKTRGWRRAERNYQPVRVFRAGCSVGAVDSKRHR